MVLIIGGAYQGKTAYAQTKYALRDAEIFTCESEALDLTARCLRHLERFALACVRTGKEPADVLAGLDLSGKILICEDISCGVVPMDAAERAWRERHGALLQQLSRRSETVIRIFCGLPQHLKP